MRWSRLKEWFDAWCPKESLKRAVMFQSVRQTLMLNLATNSISVLVFLALGLSIVFQGITGMHQILLGGENVASGILRLISILPLFYLIYLFFRWFRLSQITRFDLKTMISLTFGFYALSELVKQIINRSILAQYTDILDILYGISSFCLRLVFGLSLFRLSSFMIERQEFDAKSLRLTIICLAVSAIEWVLSLIRLLFLNSIEFAWFFWFGYVMISAAFLFLFIDVFRRKRFRKRSICIAFLLMAIAYALVEIPILLRDLPFVTIFPGFNILFGQTVVEILSIFSYLLVIVVSYSLVRGGKWEGRNLKLSFMAIFLYVSSYLSVNLYGILNNSLLLITSTYSIFEQTGVGRIIVSELISLPYLISLLAIGLLLYRGRDKWTDGWVSEESFVSPKMFSGVMFLARVRSVLTQKKVKVAVSAVIIIFLFLLSQGTAIIAYFSPTPSEWKHIAHYEDPVGDHMSPSVDINGTALGGVNYEGADIINVSMYSPVNSNELTLTVCLKNKGRADSTMDENNTRVMIWFGGDKWGGYAYLYYNGWRGFGVCSNLTDGYEYDIIRPPTERLQWASDNVMKVTFKGLPQGVVLSYLRVETGMEYVEETETEYGALILRDLDNLLIENYDYDLSSGETVTLQDLSKQLSPLFNSTMRGMDIQMVDVYRRGKYVSITVALSDLGINDSSIPSTFKIDRRIVTVQLKEKKPTSGPMTYEWNDLGNCCNVTFNLDDYGGLENVQVIKIDTFAKFYPMLDGEIVDGGYSLRWIFDFYYFSMPR